MKEVKKGLRLLIIVLLLILASFGIGITGNFLSNNRERYLDNEIKTEKADKKEDKADEDTSKK